eukprot:11024409-Alexandrium_andersonii.AAC.1
MPLPLLVRGGRGVASHAQLAPLLCLDRARIDVRTLGLDRAPNPLERAKNRALHVVFVQDCISAN